MRVVFRKYDGSLHWHFTARLLGEDEHGVWVGQAAGAAVVKGNGPVVPISFARAGVVPRRAGWVAWFGPAPDPIEVYCDVTTVAVWPTEAEVTMVDLDLDVIRERDGSIQLLDEDEFAVHQLRYRYPDDVIAEASRTAGWLCAALDDGTQPFASAYLQWLAQVPDC